MGHLISWRKALVSIIGIIGTFAVIGSSATYAASAAAPVANPCTAITGVVASSAFVPDGDLLRSGDPVGPFPLATLVPFPWNSIEGIWGMRDRENKPIYFSFDVQEACDGRQFVKVQRFDEKYNVLGGGIGLALANDTTVRAVMSADREQYMLYIRQFKQTSGSGRSMKTTLSTIVTSRPFGGGPQNDDHMVATRFSALTLDKYVEKLKQEQQLEEQARRESESRRRRGPSRP